MEAGEAKYMIWCKSAREAFYSTKVDTHAPMEHLPAEGVAVIKIA